VAAVRAATAVLALAALFTFGALIEDAPTPDPITTTAQQGETK
jgi:hypothetical protein